MPFAAILLMILIIILEFDHLSMVSFENLLKFLIYRYPYTLSIAVNMVLYYALLTKKRNNFLIVVLSCAALIKLVDLIIDFSTYNSLIFVAYVVLLAISLALCEQTIIKAELVKFKHISSKLFFLPALICTAAFVCIFVFNFQWLRIFFQIKNYHNLIMRIIPGLLECIFLFLLAKWMKDPYAKSVAISETTNNGPCTEKELSKKILICLLIIPLIIPIIGFIPGGSSNSSTKDDYGHDKYDAITIAKKAVEKELVSPSTASFCTSSDYDVTCSGNSWTVKGYVDAQNILGATIRNEFTVKFTFTSDKNYTIDYCTIT